jgi:hypothetical protein
VEGHSHQSENTRLWLDERFRQVDSQGVYLGLTPSLIER